MDDLASSFDDAWARFQASDSLQLADDTSWWDWTRGRAQFLTFLVRPAGDAARAHLARVVERLASIPGVEPYPDWYWHITVKGAGFQVIKRTHEDDVLRQDVARIAGKARALFAREATFEGQLGLANAFASVVFVEVWDGGRMRELNTRLLAEVPEIARYPIDGEGYLPHISIASFTSSEGLAELKSMLEALRAEGPGPRCSASQVAFVKVWLSEEPPEFDEVAAYPLRDATSAGNPR